jgi:transposase
MEKLYLGVDLHAMQLTAHQISVAADGKVTRNRTTVRSAEFDQFFERLARNSQICVEASTSCFEFARRARLHGASVHVVHPQAMRELYCTSKKTDRVDAKKLADRLKRHLEDEDQEDGFPEVWVPGAATEEMRILFGSYEFTRKQLVATKNRIALVFRRRMIMLPDRTTETIRNNLDHQQLREEDRFELQLMLNRLELLDQQRAEIRARIEARVVEIHPAEVRLLVSIPGISIFIAAAIMAEIGDINRFGSAKKLSAYLCAAPTVDSSGQTRYIGNLSKRGRKRTYRFLLQSLHHVVSYTPSLCEYLERKRQGKHVCKVRAAIVRKTIVAIYYILKNKEVYRYVNRPLFERKLKEIQRLSPQAA